MPVHRRLRRKLTDILRYPREAYSAADVPALLALGLVRNRCPMPGLVLLLLAGGRRVLSPRIRGAFGQRIRVNLAEQSNIDTFEELFFERIYRMEAVDFDPALVLDCGAYCGYFSAMAAGRFPVSRIVCFEANPANLGMLREQLALLANRVELVPEAVQTRTGTIRFSGAGVGGGVSDSAPEASSVEVKCIDLPGWVTAAAPSSLVLKMDVEGAELELLPALVALLPRRTVLYLETHFPDATCESLLAPYRAAGFEVQHVRSRLAEAGDFSYIEWLITRA
ncbi:MAG TPA: FkbM family methyltransferase [Opitutaceae bacterium]|jgi:FkbM family methyltransferase|nr:FkbM family methyltransferase [Opitutaceae bacterium]